MLAEFRSNRIQGGGQPMRGGRHGCRLVIERQLLGRRLQPIDLQRQACDPHPPAKTPVEETSEHRLKVRFPACAMRQSFMRYALDVVAVPEEKPQTSTHPLLPSKRGAERLQQSIQPSEQERIVHFVGIERERPFNHRLCSRRVNRRRIDAQRPVVQKNGGRAEDGFQLRQRDRGDRTECAKIQILQSLDDQ